ncbi:MULTISPECIES: curli-like amyloid fiber formation chaperone CsgH [unclassified Rhizobium]|uniref:curli-like amyloid fiber formation chaperone CsgH n=1 Tax=unclassified Rhizobium TaxID=2613769 RepID=UPI00160A74DF|nr:MULTISPECIES: curli-like amyloid fiber formation chaperone CsgH [unclassified Rhizobium]MBB3543820.1 hypothetical protein [Rhizobium sp. BK399]MCS3742137.1 hypothetical protein [Rhizobium sp. BK661]
MRERLKLICLCTMASLWSSSLVSAEETTDQIVNGKISDPRIAECGVRISSGLIVPFLEANADFDGSYEIAVSKHSSSGTSQTRQTNQIKGGAMAVVQIAVDVPATAELDLQVSDKEGRMVCVLQQTVNLEAGPLRI